MSVDLNSEYAQIIGTKCMMQVAFLPLEVNILVMAGMCI